MSKIAKRFTLFQHYEFELLEDNVVSTIYQFRRWIVCRSKVMIDREKASAVNMGFKHGFIMVVLTCLTITTIPTIKADSNLALDVNQGRESLWAPLSSLPDCQQLWDSDDIPFPPLSNDYYVGNCLKAGGRFVCTLIVNSREAGDICTDPASYIGGIITPRLEAFEGHPVWTSEEYRILMYGAGMPEEVWLQVRQPADAPPLFWYTVPTEWNLYLRQVTELPTVVPEAFLE